MKCNKARNVYEKSVIFIITTIYRRFLFVAVGKRYTL